MSFSTHVLDANAGSPARGMAVALFHGEEVLAEATTDADGRWAFEGSLERGNYRIVFDTDPYFEALGIAHFYPEVSINFRVDDPAAHYHVPLLLSPFAYSTYRGS